MPEIETAEPRSTWPGWRALWERSWVAAVWIGSALGAVVLQVVPKTGSLQDSDSDDGLQTAVQVVPAIVIAIFVFAVGTLFVVAQVVPIARGTRAVAFLRKQNLGWTISPALALAPLSGLVLLLKGDWAQELAVALLLGSIVYLFASTACLLAILGEATDPDLFGNLLRRRYRSALRTLRGRLPPGSADSSTMTSVLEQPPRRLFRRNAQAAIDDLYDVVRTLRGWARSAATTGDSRELQVALEVTLELVRDYVDEERKHARLRVPTAYWRNARKAQTNPLYAEQDDLPGQNDDGQPGAARVEGFEEWAAWLPPPFRLASVSKNRPDPARESPESWRKRLWATVRGSARPQEVEARSKALPETWVANEVARAMVRAVEFATTSKTLLDRDRGRLVRSLEKATRLLAKDPANAGIMIAYLIELGVGARRCPAEELDWHFDPLAALARLHRRIAQDELPIQLESTQSARSRDLVDSEPRRPDEILPERSSLLVGSAAGVLIVAEAITAARIRAFRERHPVPAQNGAPKPNGDQRRADEKAMVTRMVTRTVTELKAIRDIGRFQLFPTTHRSGAGAKAKELIESRVLEPHDLPTIYPTDPGLVAQLLDEFIKPPPEKRSREGTSAELVPDG
jgi:hypothetical protein